METKTFKTVSGLDFVIKSRPHAVIFYCDEYGEKSGAYSEIFSFTKETFNDLMAYLMRVSTQCWKNFRVHEAQNDREDYDEYYDSKLENNGYLASYGYHLVFERPMLDNHKLYQFNKPRMETFLFDIGGNK